ncbi:MAG: class B sortase [Clostridia bacterium]|nr:class B sortase [Clostridia bacterium]
MEENKKANPVRNTPIARTGAVNNPDNTAGDIFSAVYREKKIQNEQEKIEAQRIAAQQAAQAQQITSVSAIPENDANDKKIKPVFIILIIITIVLFLASGIYLALSFLNKKPSADNSIDVPVVNTTSASLSSPFEYQRLYGVDFPEGMQDKYKLLYAQNDDFVGWITVPNTSIDMPVYQCSNNEYYLKHDSYDTYTKYGTLFLDKENNPVNLTRNTTIYGHNFDNKSIFDELHNYQDPEFFKQSPVIEFNTLYKDYKWKVIAAFHTNGSSEGDNGYLFYYIASDFGNNSFMKFYDELQQRSYIHTGVDVQPTDKVLTLSTCTYFFDRNGALENARFVVIARLVRDGESEEVDTSLVTTNNNVRYPQLYYDVFGGTNPWRNSSKWVPEIN